MIDIKVIKKPKNEGSTSALRTSGTAYGGMAVKEAAHAAKADIAELAKEAVHAKDSDHAVEADHSKEADHAVNADESKHALEADHAKEADNADKWDYHEFDDYLNQPVRKTDGVTFDSVTSDSIRSAGQFVDGLLGAGFQLWKGEYGRTYLTVDKLTVRQTMAVLELLIEKVRSVGGQICVSAANGRIKTVEESDEHYLITFEQDNMFVQHDLVRCQTFTGKDMRSYWVEVTDVTETGIVVVKEEFEGVEPKEGDECVLMGNTANTDRQNMVLISATEDGQPRVDVMDGVSGKTFDNALRARLGNLDGIKDDKFPADRQPRGNGLYADNAYMKGTFVLETGEDVKTRFEITEGKVQSAIDSVRNDFLSEKGYLRQKHENLRFVPTFPTESDGKKEALPVYLSFFYRCAKGGTLKIGFENVDKTGFADFNSMEVSEEIAATGGYVQYTCSGLWNGTGDFKLAFDGDIYLYMLVLSTDKIEALTYKYKTLFEQSERLVKISAAVYDKDERALDETGLIVTSKVSGMYAIDVDGNLKSFVGAGQDGVKIKASNIQLEGLVTANENFKILKDGSIEAKNGKFTGEIESYKGTIGGFTIGNGRIGSEATQSGEGGSLAIYSNFFRVGGNDGYVMFGNDVIPGTAGGAFTATGRIVNEHPNTYGNYGLDQANYGLFIHVSGGTKNYGIWSNAALMAPSFVNTKAKILTFDPNATSYSVDFSQANVILMYFKKDKSSGVKVTLPSESSVAEKFGLTELPEDFATVVTFRVRAGSLPITLDGIYDHNENLTNYKMVEGDSVTVLISKVDGFRYQILNHSS